MSAELPRPVRPPEPAGDLFRLLVESVREYAIFMLDAGGHVATWNAGAERIKGWTAAEIVGRHFSTFYPEEDVRAGKCELELEIAAREGRVEDEGWRVRKDGSRFWASVVINAVRTDDGGLLGFAKVTRDLTDRRRAEEAHTARRAAEQANRAKDEFLAMLGHELRNPLAPIVTALQLMKLRGDTRSAREQQVMERQVRHMMHLIDDLLDVARITRGKIELKRRRIDVRDVLAKAIEIASPLLEQRAHHLDVQVPPEAIVIEGDEARLVQVFANLVTNAAKYTPPRGHIGVALAREVGEVVVEVRDDGVGIEDTLLPRIFDLFVQGYQSSDRSVGGLGLGLTLVRSLVDLHGGRIAVSSAGPGTGSTFTVHLPAIDLPIEAAARGGAPVAGAMRRQRVLVVDDNADARVLLGDVLEALGCDVATAGDGAEALEVVERFRPEIAVLDIGLPVMDGYELAGRLRERLGADAPRMIALTGYGQRTDVERSREAGFDIHLIKPVDLQRLLEAIHGVPE